MTNDFGDVMYTMIKFAVHYVQRFSLVHDLLHMLRAGVKIVMKSAAGYDVL